MRLKISDSHLTCKVANKCLNVRQRVEVLERSKRWSPPFPCCLVNHQCLKKTLMGKKPFRLRVRQFLKLKIFVLEYDSYWNASITRNCHYVIKNDDTTKTESRAYCVITVHLFFSGTYLTEFIKVDSRVQICDIVKKFMLFKMMYLIDEIRY